MSVKREQTVIRCVNAAVRRFIALRRRNCAFVGKAKLEKTLTIMKVDFLSETEFSCYIGVGLR